MKHIPGLTSFRQQKVHEDNIFGEQDLLQFITNM